MSKKNIKKHGRRTKFDEELSSLDDAPSTGTSLNDAALGFKSVASNERANGTTGAELSEVTEMEKRASAADSGEELHRLADSCIEQAKCEERTEEKKSRRTVFSRKTGTSDFLRKLRKLVESCDDQLEYFRQSVSEMLDSAYALTVKIFGSVHTYAGGAQSTRAV